jgi:glycosyltransferase involved in cell wall biosynthesis
MAQMDDKTVAMPKVTIAIPVYNGANFLREAIDSALSQTYPNIEIVVVNDGSKDDGATEQIALSYGDRIRYCSKQNGGVASALNLAVENMTGEYFSWLSHDDLYTNDKVEKEVAAVVRATNDSSIIYCDYSVFINNPAGAIARRLKNVAPESFRYWLTVGSGLHGCTLLIPRRAFEEIGGFNESLRTTQDRDLWFRMAKDYSFIHIPEVLVKSRFHDAQGSRVMSSIAKTECNNLFSKFISEMDSQEILRATGKPLAESYARIASRMFSLGLSQAANLAESYARQHDTNKVTFIIRNVGYLINRIAYMLRALLPAGIFVHIKMFILRMRTVKTQ